MKLPTDEEILEEAASLRKYTYGMQEVHVRVYAKGLIDMRDQLKPQIEELELKYQKVTESLEALCGMLNTDEWERFKAKMEAT